MISSGQLRAVQKELHDRGVSEISLPDLLERLRVGPFQQPATDFVPLDAEAGRRRLLRRSAELIRSGLLDVITPEELADLGRPRIERGADGEPDLVAAEDEMEKLVRYFEETEERLGAENDSPVHLVETQSARRVLFTISRLLDDEAERNRAWKHADPSEMARAFIDLVAGFVKEWKLSWQELAQELRLEPSAFARLSRYGSEEEAN
jgi:hypothetical protein